MVIISDYAENAHDSQIVELLQSSIDSFINNILQKLVSFIYLLD